MASPLPTESHGSGPPADELPLAQSPPPPTVSATAHSWSQLPSDLLQLVFDRLGFADFQRAKSVCSSWQSVSRNSQPNNQIPWMIRFPKGTNNNYGLLFNPEEKDKMYKTPNLGNDFAKSSCVASCRSWLLMQPRYKYMEEEDFQCNIYILDLLTRERINLPTFESALGLGLTSPILWIDEKTKDHLVIGMATGEYAISFKKGDDSWKQIPTLSGIEECFSMVYKDQKLYCLNYGKLKVFDFSGDIPLRVSKTSMRGCLQPPAIDITVRGVPWEHLMAHFKNNVVITIGGDVLVVRSCRRSMSKIWEFKIYKMEGNKKWEKIVSLGDEAILLDLGMTVLAKDMKGIKRNSIYFFNDTPYFEDQYDENEIFIFNLDSNEVEQPHRFVCSSFPCSRARWFLPSFKRE